MEQIANPRELVDTPGDGRRQIALCSIWPRATAAAGSNPFFADSINYDERSLSAYLTLLAQGQIRIATIPLASTKPRHAAAA